LSAAAPEVEAAVADAPPTRRPGRLARLARAVRRIPHPPLRSRRGLFILFVLIAGFGSALTVGGVMGIAYTDTPAFCAACHTMAPEITAYENSPHRQVACVDCHTEPGLGGWIQSKVNGIRQLVEVATGTFPKPVPPPDHSLLPSSNDTCLRCHDIAPLLAGGGPIKLVLRAEYGLDTASTKQTVALVVRPAGFGGSGATVGVHWHVASHVDFLSSDTHSQSIDYVSVTNPDGKSKNFIASSAITQSDDVQADVDRLTANDYSRRMD
jgi:hypothetical protein